MPTQMVAYRAATLSACERLKSDLTLAWRAALGLLVGPLLAGCVTTAPLAGADPADPQAKVANVGYRPTIAPYVSLRPASPTSWKDQNRRVAPTPKNEQ
jgi:hypothetical protein